MDFFSVDPDPVDPKPRASKKARKVDQAAAELKANLSALSKETLVGIMLNSVSHGTGGGGGSVSWLRQRATEAVAALPVEERPGYTIRSADSLGADSSGAGSSGAGSSHSSMGESAKLHFDDREMQLVGTRHGSGVRVGLRIFRGCAAELQVGKILSVPETDDGNEFIVRWATGKYPNVRYLGALETLDLAALKACTWSHPPKTAVAAATGGAGGSWTLRYFHAQLEELARHEANGLGEQGLGVMACLLLTPPVTDAIAALCDSHPDEVPIRPALGITRNSRTGNVTLQQVVSVPFSGHHPSVPPPHLSAVELPQSAVSLYTRSSVDQLPSGSEPVWVFMPAAIQGKQPPAVGDAVHCFSLLTLLTIQVPTALAA